MRLSGKGWRIKGWSKKDGRVLVIATCCVLLSSEDSSYIDIITPCWDGNNVENSVTEWALDE